jgi:hypothetical protein
VIQVLFPDGRGLIFLEKESDCRFESTSNEISLLNFAAPLIDRRKFGLQNLIHSIENYTTQIQDDIKETVN